MDLVSRISLTLKNTPHFGRGTNSVSKMLDIYERLGEKISRRTVTRDFLKLEAEQMVRFVGYDGLAKLYCQPETPKLKCSESLAWVLTSLEQPLRKLCTDEMLHSIEAELEAAKEKLRKFVKYNPNSKLCRFSRILEPVAANIAKPYYSDNVLNPIKEVLWDDSYQLEIKQAGLVNGQALIDVTLKKIDDTVYLCGKLAEDRSSTVRVSLETITSASISAKMPFQRRRASLKAA